MTVQLNGLWEVRNQIVRHIEAGDVDRYLADITASIERRQQEIDPDRAAQRLVGTTAPRLRVGDAVVIKVPDALKPKSRDLVAWKSWDGFTGIVTKINRATYKVRIDATERSVKVINAYSLRHGTRIPRSWCVQYTPPIKKGR